MAQARKRQRITDATIQEWKRSGDPERVVAAELAARINAGRLPGMTEPPSAIELAQELEVTSAQALRGKMRLVDLGYLVVDKGFYVSGGLQP